MIKTKKLHHQKKLWVNIRYKEYLKQKDAQKANMKREKTQKAIKNKDTLFIDSTIMDNTGKEFYTEKSPGTFYLINNDVHCTFVK